jgi:hypothetical protein
MRAALVGAFLAFAAPALAQTEPSGAPHEPPATLNLFGVSGLVNMPGGAMLPDGEVAATVSGYPGSLRNTFTFQITPWAQGSFRYVGFPDAGYYDRSFDLRLRLLREGRYLPAVSVGVEDVGGTALYSAEFVALTKALGPRLRVTAGLGWGRLGTYRPQFFTGAVRPPYDYEEGGRFNAGQWFRGPVEVFGGLSWHPTDRLALKIEHSSDAQTLERDRFRVLDPRTQINLGVEYAPNDMMRIGAYALGADKVALSAQFVLNPARPAVKGVLGPAPPPVVPRAARHATGADADGVRADLRAALAQQGLALEALELEAATATAWLRNTVYDAPAQAIGRAARVMANTLPASVETFVIVPVLRGNGASRITLARDDIERLEAAPDNAAALLARARIEAAPTRMPRAAIPEGLYPRLGWRIGPYVQLGLFDPDAPLRADAGLRFSAALDLAPGLVLSGSVTKKIAGNRDESTREDCRHPDPLAGYTRPGVPPCVRTISNSYAKIDPTLERLTLAWNARGGRDIYTRVSGGYLERGFAGVTAEMLWKPVDSPFALGAEVAHVRQRSFDVAGDAAEQLFGLHPYRTTTGHVSAHYAFANGFHVSVDAGRYLARDWGATVEIRREFANGWRVGAYATLTDMSFEEYGEGSFDKGLTLQIPITWAIGTPTRARSNARLQLLRRDGGARLELDGRLYEEVRDYHLGGIESGWGRVWR